MRDEIKKIEADLEEIRQRLAALKSQPDPGKGYRIIDPKTDGPKRPTDEYLNTAAGTWKTVNLDHPFLSEVAYRRKIEPRVWTGKVNIYGDVSWNDGPPPYAANVIATEVL